MSSTLYILMVSTLLAMLAGCGSNDRLWMPDGTQTSSVTQQGDNDANNASSNNGGTTGSDTGGNSSSSNNGSTVGSNNGSASGSNNGDDNSNANNGGSSNSTSNPYAIILLALEGDALKVSGGGDLKTLGDIAVNSKHRDAVDVDGCGSVSADEVFLRGGYEGRINAKIRDLKEPVADPQLRAPSDIVVRSQRTLSISKSTELLPGLYHGGIQISGGPSVKVTFKPGLYVLDGKGGFSVSGSGEVSGAGAKIFVDVGAKISGSGKTSLEMLYSPMSTLSFSGSGNSNIGSVISSRLYLSGSGNLSVGN